MRGIVLDDVCLPLPPLLLLSSRADTAGSPTFRSVAAAVAAIVAPALETPAASIAATVSAASPPSPVCVCRYQDGDRCCLALTAFGSPPLPLPPPAIAATTAAFSVPSILGSSTGSAVSLPPAADVPVDGSEGGCSAARAFVSAAARVEGVEWLTSEAWPPRLRLAVYHEWRGLPLSTSLSLSSESSWKRGRT